MINPNKSSYFFKPAFNSHGRRRNELNFKLKYEDYNFTYNQLVKYNEHLYKDVNIFDIVQPLWYSFYKSIELKKKYELKNGFKYDYVLKLRPDIKYPWNYHVQKTHKNICLDETT